MGRRDTIETDIRPFKKFEVTDPALNGAVSTTILDTYSLIIITTTGASNAQTLQSPGVVTNSTRITIANNDTSTNAITINGTSLEAGTVVEYIWDGSVWSTEAGASVTSIVGITGTTAEFNTALTDNSFATLAGAETLTNKTLTSPKVNVTSDATGDIYYRNAGGLFTRLPKGTDTQVLTLASGIPAWEDAASGGGSFNFQYPHDVTDGFTPIIAGASSSTPYTVPVGKQLYIHSIATNSASTQSILLGGFDIAECNYAAALGYLDLAVPLLVEESEDVDGDSGTETRFNGFLVNKNVNIQPIYSNGTYTVPAGKIFVATHFFRTVSTGISVTIGGVTKTILNSEQGAFNTDISMNSIHSPLLMGAGDSINTAINKAGYLIPDDFVI